MTQVSKKGMKLRQTELSKKRNYGWLLHMLVAMLATMVFIITFVEITGFGELYVPWAGMLAGGCVCIVYGILEKLGKKQWFYPGVLVVLLIFVLMTRNSIMDGICLFWNQWSDNWTANTGWILAKLDVQSAGTNAGFAFMSVSVLFGGLTALVICFFSANAVVVTAVLLPGALLVTMLVSQQEVSALHILFVLLSAVCLLLYSGWEKQKSSMAVVFGWLVIGGIAVFMIPLISFAGLEGWTASVSEDFKEAVHHYKYETEYTTLPEGDFTSYEEPEEEKMPALVVSMKKPEVLYLRGFTGDLFEGDVWTQLDTETLAENKDLLYWIQWKEFQSDTQFAKAVSGMEEATEQSVTVQNVGACSRYLYVPFQLSAKTELSAEDLNTGGITADGERTYTFRVTSQNANAVGTILNNLQTSTEQEVLDYRQAESAYREFVYSHYMQVPQEITDILAEEWDKTASQYGSVEQLTAEQAQECAVNFLEQCFTEEEGKASMVLPLSVADGTSYQKATVAVMTLRYFGIPARYAEGYIISKKMVGDTKASTSIEVDSSCGGAWCEVYQDGIGWMPMDLAPGMEKLKPKEAEDAEQEEEKNNLKEAEELDEKPQQQPESDNGFAIKIPKLTRGVLYKVLLVILLLIIIFMVRRKILIGRKNKLFHEENRKDAIACIFADTALLLQGMGFHRQNGSMENLREPIKEKFDEAYASDYWNMVQLNSCAMFSSQEMTKEQWEFALKFHETTLQHLKSSTKWYQRAKMKWIQCLY